MKYFLIFLLIFARLASTEIVSSIQNEMDRLTANNRVPGLSCTLIIGRQDPYHLTSGYADLEHHLPITPSTQFKQGSVVKTLIAFLIIDTFNKRNIPLDISLEELQLKCKFTGVLKNLCEKDSWLKSMTIKQLLTHTSRIYHEQKSPAYMKDILSDPHKSTTVEKHIQRALDMQICVNHFEYSNVNYMILGLVLQECLQQKFFEYFLEHDSILYFDKKDLQFYSDKIATAHTFTHLATMALFPNARQINSHMLEISYEHHPSWDDWAGGALLMTPAALAKWLQSALEGPVTFFQQLEIYATPTKKELQNIPLPPAMEIHYGLGIWLLKMPSGTVVYHVLGEQWGFQSGAFFILDQDHFPSVIFTYATNVNNYVIEEEGGFLKKVLQLLERVA